MNFKQAVLQLFPWVQSHSVSDPEPPSTTSEATPAPQPPVMMSFYGSKAKRMPGRRSPAGSR